MNCPICDRVLRTRYDINEFFVRCPIYVRKPLTVGKFGAYNNGCWEKSHFEQSILWLKNKKIKNTTFIMHDMIFESGEEITNIYGLDSHKHLLSLPKEMQPKIVDLQKIKALLLFS